MLYIKSKNKQNRGQNVPFSRNELNALNCFSSIEEVFNFADKVKLADSHGTSTYFDDRENAVEYVTNLRELANKTKGVHPIVESALKDNIEDLAHLRRGIENEDEFEEMYETAYTPRHVAMLPLKSNPEKMVDLAKYIRELNISAGVKKPSVEFNDSAVNILENLKRHKFVDEDEKFDEKTIQEYRALPPEIRTLITKNQASQPRKGMAA